MRLPRALHLVSGDSGREPKDCRCGHPSRAHEHYRRGTDCALCTCPKYRAGAPARRRPQPGPRDERAHAA